MHQRLTGIEIVKPAEPELFDYDDGAVGRVVGTIEAPKGLGYAEAYLRERSLPGSVRKAAVVSPFEMTVAARGDAAAINQQMPGLIAIVNRELRALADAGCPHVQLDAPLIGVFVTVGLLTAKQGADGIAGCFAGVNAKKSLHFCNGNLRGRPNSPALRCAPWVDVLQHLEGVVDVAAFEVKYFAQYMEREAFKGLPKSMELAAGLVDEAS